MKAVFVIIGVIIVLILFGVMLSGIDDAQTSQRDDAFAGVATAPAVYTADVQLVVDIYDNNIVNVVSIISDNALDAPLPDTYVAASNTLTVRGLAANDSRSLVVTYKYGSLTGTAAKAGTFLDMIPLLMGMIIVVIIVAAGYMAWSRSKGG